MTSSPAVRPDKDGLSNQRPLNDEDRLQAILDATADGVVVVDAAGRISFANKAAERLFGRRAKELLGGDFGFPVAAGKTMEIDVLRPGGQMAIAEMRVVDLTWEGQSAHLACLRDVTEQKRAQATRDELLKEQAARREVEAALRDRDEFLSVLNHELRTPLTRLKLWVRRALRYTNGVGETEEVQQALEQADQEADQLSRLLAQLLELSRIEDGTRPLFLLRTDLTRQMQRHLERSSAAWERRRIEIRTPDGPLMATIDRTVFDQVVASMISYALRCSPPEGSITLDMHEESEKQGRHSVDMVRISVQYQGRVDTGGQGERLYGQSFVSHQSGYAESRGLWFYVSQKLAERHGGRLDVEALGEESTRVTLVLPLEAREGTHA